MGQTLALIRMELIRLFFSRRWLAGLLIWAVVAKLAADEVAGHAFSVGGINWTAYDVHAALMNNTFLVSFLMLMTFVLIACDSLAHDRETRFAHVVMVRAGSRWQWWVSKVMPMLLAAFVFQAGAFGASIAVGVYSGGSLSRAPLLLHVVRLARVLTLRPSSFSAHQRPARTCYGARSAHHSIWLLCSRRSGWRRSL